LGLWILGTIINNDPEYQAGQTQTAIWLASQPPTSTNTAKPFKTLQPTRTTRPTKTPISTSTKTIVPSATQNPSLQILMDNANLSQVEAGVALSVIQSVGLERVYDLTLQLGSEETRKHYLADVGYTKRFLITFEDNEIVFIGTDKLTLYDSNQGGAVDNIENYILNDEGTYIYLTEQVVKAALKSPSTAKFPGFLEMGDWHISRDHDIVWVRSWVDAQNSFGAVIRSYFTVQFSYSTQELLYLEMDNQVVYGVLQTP
jgi:hypothetical protein